MHVKENMALRQEQKTQLLQSRRDLMDTMAALLQERRMIQALIKASLLVPASSLADPLPDHLAPALRSVLGCGMRPVRFRLSPVPVLKAKDLSVKSRVILPRSAAQYERYLKPGAACRVWRAQ